MTTPQKQVKHIFVTGGVVSSLGKGLTSASIGMLLEHRGLRVRLQKFDPYINVDPGTMSPYQPGEVYVLDDGAKTKPTQHSVVQLRQIGIQPDVLICRSEREMTADMKEKIALFCNVEARAVIEERDKQYSIYEVPVSLVDNKLDELIVERLQLR